MNLPPDYTYYSQTYHGTMTADAFGKAVISAWAAVQRLIGFRAIPEEHEAACAKACCAAADAVSAYGDGRGFSIGSYREDSVDSSLQVENAALDILLPTGLCFLGVDR